MGQRFSYYMRLTLLVTDFLIVNGCLLLGYRLNLWFNEQEFFWKTLFSTNLDKLVVINIAWLISAFIFRLYGQQTVARVEYVFRQTWRTAVVHIVAAFVGLYFLQDVTIRGVKYVSWDKSFIIFYGILIASLFTVSRFLLTYIIEFMVKKTKIKRKIAIVGYNETGIQLAAYFKDHHSIYSFAGFFDNTEGYYSVNAGGKIVGPIEKCINYAVENNIKEIYSTILPNQHTEVDRLIEYADRNCVRVKFVPGNPESGHEDFHHMEYIDKFPVVALRAEPLYQQRNRVKKMIFDILFSSFVILFILSWLTPLIGLLIKLESRGPMFFKQKRTGEDNEPFWCLKFRSMTVNKDSDSVQATKNDMRITKIGAFLRKTSLDELPQFFNVIRGEMSIIGPRPHMLKHTEEYGALIDNFMVRHFLKPGITGWAQVNGYRGETKDTETMAKRVEYDIWYMENWSLMLDIKVIFMTIINIFKGEENAY